MCNFLSSIECLNKWALEQSAYENTTSRHSVSILNICADDVPLCFPSLLLQISILVRRRVNSHEGSPSCWHLQRRNWQKLHLQDQEGWLWTVNHKMGEVNFFAVWVDVPITWKVLRWPKTTTNLSLCPCHVYVSSNLNLCSVPLLIPRTSTWDGWCFEQIPAAIKMSMIFGLFRLQFDCVLR